MKQVTIIDYGSGNLHSIAKAFEKEGKKKSFKIVVSDRVEDLKTATHIVLPGVGAFGDCIAGLEKLLGMKEALEQAVIKQKKPFMGVCVGMQMLADEGQENGTHKGLGWIPGKVVPIKPQDNRIKIPHMGWNELVVNSSHPILSGIRTGDHVYFVHSYHFKAANTNDAISTVEYGMPLVAVLAKDNIVAAQFHPEKSQKTGLKFIANFLEM
ncbi:MAG: hisH [Rickettsiaceae bacterium]|jgi:glutamine amidotransferase|nr:hisH [Rickettsiaceae bacterium]